jgi:hypothetical protein
MGEQCTPYINIVPITRSPGGYRSAANNDAAKLGLTEESESPAGPRLSGIPAADRADMKKQRARPHGTPDGSRDNLRRSRRETRQPRPFRHFRRPIEPPNVPRSRVRSEGHSILRAEGRRIEAIERANEREHPDGAKGNYGAGGREGQGAESARRGRQAPIRSSRVAAHRGKKPVLV